MAASSVPPEGVAVKVPRWPSEAPLRALVVISALGIWLLLAVSLIGIAYALVLGLFFFFAHLALITHLRGNGVRLGPEQMPDLHRRVQELAAKIGMRRVPDAYVLQSGGVLNAFATRFLGSSFIVLYSDLLEACGEDEAARDFVVAHELGHLEAGHLAWRWLLLPGLFVPFLGQAYSRACEYTSDRYGMAAATDRSSALNGLCILAAGGRHGPRINRRALVEQRRDLATAWMKIGQWLGTHPPIAQRLAVLEPTLAEGRVRDGGATAGALAILALLVLVPTLATIGVARGLWPRIEQAMRQPQQAAGAAGSGAAAAPSPEQQERIRTDVLGLAAVADAARRQGGVPPANPEALYAAWRAANPGQPDPVDPFDGQPYGYQVEGAEFLIWSAGPDPDDRSDDLYYSSAEQAR
jgi:Zn-dependent protease with chaperone function